jgi:uncharacterized repeat protein (TIGR03806 family)
MSARTTAPHLSTTIAAFLALSSSLVVFTIARAGNAQTPVGIEKRTAWTTSQVNGSPDPPSPYRTTVAFRKLHFNEPLDMTAAPGTDRLFVVERFGKVLSFPNHSQADEAEVLIDIGKTLYGLAFHPNFDTNGYFYLTYILDPNKEDPKGTRVSRFQVSRDDPLKANPDTEQVLIEWPSGGHNGGCLKFGPDGYLYIATGDSSGIADEYLTGQDLTKLPGAILRINVDQPREGRRYSIPADNPFVDIDLEGARPEIWAYGLRQPWKMSFDTATGDLWAGNVGQDLWEQVFIIERGGNYGWSVMEGGHPFRPERQRGPSPFVPPIVEHDHAEFRSITGGYMYHGSRLAELSGAYIYGDYDTGEIWMLRYDPQTQRVTEHQELVDSALRLVGFAEDHTGEIYLLDHVSGMIYQLEKNPETGNQADFPRKLSETGLFTSVKDHNPAVGAIPYSVIAPQWVDGASKERFLALPGQSQIEFDGITYPQPAPGAPHGWKFPDGTVAVETLSMELEKGNPKSRRRLETRILHFEKLAGSEEVGDQYWRGYTYVWNDEQTDAVLLEDPLGKDMVLSIKDADASGGKRTQTWHIPSRTECTVCHNMAAKYALGINTLQMNRDYDYGGVTDNQLRTFDHIGLFTQPLAKSPQELPKLVDYSDSAQDLNRRARSYLHANCSHCHRKWGGGNGQFLLLASITREDMGIVDVKPAHGGFFMSGAKLVAPGHPEESALVYRTSTLGPGRMPRIGSSVVDQAGLDLIHNWILSLSDGPVAQETRDDLSVAEFVDRHLSTTSGALRLTRAVDKQTFSKGVIEQIVARGTKHEAAHIRDLFERYLPEEDRTKRLGNIVRPQVILAIEGSIERGRELFLEAAGVQCKNCHKIKDNGSEVGPDLSQIAKKYPDRSRLLDTILNPSREIDPKFRTYMLATADGNVHTGLLVKKDEQQVVLKDAKNKLVEISSDDVEQLVPQQQSLMPDLLLRDMTKEQVADLLAYLSSLK